MKKFKDTNGNPTLLKFGEKTWGIYKKWQCPDLLLYKYFVNIESSKRERKYVPFFELWRDQTLIKKVSPIIPKRRISLRNGY